MEILVVWDISSIRGCREMYLLQLAAKVRSYTSDAVSSRSWA
jgi:hypothetical protein